MLHPAGIRAAASNNPRAPDLFHAPAVLFRLAGKSVARQRRTNHMKRLSEIRSPIQASHESSAEARSAGLPFSASHSDATSKRKPSERTRAGFLATNPSPSAHLANASS